MPEYSRAVAIETRVVEDKVVLVVEATDGLPPIIAVMTPREAHGLCSRLRKAANDASSAAARKRAAA